MPDEAALPMPPEFLREELDEEHDASYFAESDKILSFAFKSIKSPKIIVSLNGDFGKIWAGIGEEKSLSSTDKLSSFQIISIYFKYAELILYLSKYLSNQASPRCGRYNQACRQRCTQAAQGSAQAPFCLACNKCSCPGGGL